MAKHNTMESQWDAKTWSEDEIDRLRAINAELVAAIKSLTGWFCGHSLELDAQYPVMNELLREARAAIARSEGKP